MRGLVVAQTDVIGETAIEFEDDTNQSSVDVNITKPTNDSSLCLSIAREEASDNGLIDNKITSDEINCTINKSVASENFTMEDGVLRYTGEFESTSENGTTKTMKVNGNVTVTIEYSEDDLVGLKEEIGEVKFTRNFTYTETRINTTQTNEMNEVL